MIRKVFICDAYEAGFNIEPVSLNDPDDTDNLKDLKLTRVSGSYEEIDESTVYCINGLIYPSVVREDGIYLVNANEVLAEGATLIRANRIGKLSKTHISTENILNPQDLDTSSENPIYIKTDFNLFENSFLFVFLGFLFINDSRISIIDSNTLMIRQLSLDIDKKFLLANKNFNDSTLNSLMINDTTVKHNEILKFENLQKLFSNPNSFIIAFDKIVTFNNQKVIGHGLPGRYTMSEFTNDIVLTDTGKVLEYGIIKNGWDKCIAANYTISNISRNRTTVRGNISTTTSELPYEYKYENIYSHPISI